MVYVKKVRIQGFKSYKNLEVEEFNRKSNTIVGPNGSGKSNFLSAILFVLSDLYSSSRSEERKALLHEGTGTTSVMSAFVEIVFDNSDHRFPLEMEEIVLRRQIGLKKDEYFLNSKHVTKHDVVNLLESAGFSRSNPYYIVQQGKVKRLAMMKEKERLDLLKEVAGTRVYDERKSEALKSLEDTEGRKDKINEVLTYIEERLHELEEEKEELKEYQTLDKRRRALEYAYYDKELKGTLSKLEQIEKVREEEATRASRRHLAVLEARDEIKTLEKQIKSLSTEIKDLNSEKQSYDIERQDLIKQRAKLELDLADVKSGLASSGKLREQAETELKDVENRMTSNQSKLAKLLPMYEEAVAKERQLKGDLLDSERRINELYSKEGRKKQFNSEEERDQWLRNQAQDVEQTLVEKDNQLKQAESELVNLQEKIAGVNKEITQRESQLEAFKKNVESYQKQHNELRKKRDEATNIRKELWRKADASDRTTEQLKSELMKCERNLQSTIAKDMANGIQAVQRIAQQHNLTGVYGPVIELFECPAPFLTAVEVTAGNRLFHIVCDTDATVTRVLEELNKARVGRVSFMPLNRLSPSSKMLPDSEDVKPMIDQLSFDPEFEKAFTQIFGKTLICRNLDVASSFSKEHNLNCVTMEGDQVNRKGALTGGFHDVRRSRLEAMKGIRDSRQKLDHHASEAGKLKVNLQSSEQQVNKVLGEMQNLETRIQAHRNHIEQVAHDLRGLIDEKNLLTASLETKENVVVELKLSHQQLQEHLNSLKSEIGTMLMSQLTDTQYDNLDQLTGGVNSLQEELLAASKAKAELETEKQNLETEMSTLLSKRKQDLEAQLEKLGSNNKEMLVQEQTEQLQLVSQSVKDTTQKITQIEKNVEKKEQVVRELQKEVETKATQEVEQTTEIQSESKKVENVLNKRTLLLQKQEEYMRKIRELGSLPADAFEENTDKVRDIMKMLDTVNGKLKKYSHVNKKALDQYVNFTEQRETLFLRKKELDTGRESIDQLIQVLDARKDAAIERTFKQVAKHFQDVFTELVPGGSASLIMQVHQRNEDDEEGQEQVSRIRQYSGVAVKASFTPAGESYHINQLSGGQKSLLALALVFAIQRCDPAPFYIFDEIDSALDAAHRTAVANMISKQSKNAQFIITTFKPELVNVARKHYLIRFENKVSNLDVVEQEKALAVLEAADLQQVDEQ